MKTRRNVVAVLSLMATLWWTATVSAQLDPLLFMKRVPPTVIVVFDTSLRMLEDGSGTFYDPNFYSTTADPAVMAAFPGINVATTKTYRRAYRNLQYAASPGKYTASTIGAVAAAWDPANAVTSNAAVDLAFLDNTRYNIAKQGLSVAVNENRGSTFRWGLIRLRQNTPAWRTGANCDKPVDASGDASLALYGDSSPCNAGGAASGKYAIYAPSVAAASFAQAAAPAGTVVVSPAANTGGTLVSILARGPNDPAALIPAGLGGVGYEDRPIAYALEDAKSAASAAMAADTAANRSCRNTIVILITGGKNDGDSGYLTSHDSATVASQFTSVSGGGVTRKVPIYVVGVRPNAADVASLQAIATNSGGMYRSASTVFDVTAAVQFAVQAGFARAAD
ncbi:MAG TPA: hypothetical protein VF147_17110, partial [Vicinamibacterales bacterium]